MATRKHISTGKPRGGRRPGTGRPKGATNTFELGEVKALRAAGLRVPKEASEEVRALADRALDRIVDVMEETVSWQNARAVLAAATRVREETCGPLTQRLEHSGADGGPLVIEIRELTAEGEEKPPDGANQCGDGCVYDAGHEGPHSWDMAEPKDD